MNTRNEPCPCGSGKKYKKCCLPASAVPGLRSKIIQGKEAWRAEKQRIMREALLEPERGARRAEEAEAAAARAAYEIWGA